MSLDKETFGRKVEEYKEAGQELRYRDGFIVQEFYWSIVAAAAFVALWDRLGPSESFWVALLALVFFYVLATHIWNTDQDRTAAVGVRETLGKQLGFSRIHQNPEGDKRLSSIKLIKGYAVVVATAWALLAIVSGCAAADGWTKKILTVLATH